MTMKRVYHPTLNSWQDVPEGDVEAWVESGWRKSKPKHVDEDGAPPVGEHPGIASVPVLEGPASTSASAATSTAAGSGSTTSAGSGRS